MANRVKKVDMGLARQIKKLRLLAGFTQEAVAQALHISRVTYACYELGKTKPGVGRLHMLAAVYNVPYSFFADPNLLLGVETRVRPRKQWSGDKPAAVPELSPEEKVIVALMRIRSYDGESVMGELLSQIKPFFLDERRYEKPIKPLLLKEGEKYVLDLLEGAKKA